MVNPSWQVYLSPARDIACVVMNESCSVCTIGQCLPNKIRLLLRLMWHKYSGVLEGLWSFFVIYAFTCLSLKQGNIPCSRIQITVRTPVGCVRKPAPPKKGKARKYIQCVFMISNTIDHTCVNRTHSTTDHTHMETTVERLSVHT